MYVIDEFCARYGVRDAFRHLTCLKEWLECERRDESIWPVMFLSSFRFCQMHVGGMKYVTMTIMMIVSSGMSVCIHSFTVRERKGRKEGGRERGREGGRREEGKEGGRERGREEGRREEGREGGREGGRREEGIWRKERREEGGGRKSIALMSLFL